MDKKFCTITRKDLFDLFGRLSENYRVFVPYAKGDKLYFDEFDSKKEEFIELGGVRQSQPVKSFINPVREKITGASKNDARPLILAGVKGCDLSSLMLQDFVFLGGGIEDPLYADGRKRALLIGHDCTYAKETCFCLAMEGAPYPKSYFDLSLSPVDNYFIVEVGSLKGSSIIDNFKMFFKDIGQPRADVRQPNRDRVTKEVKDLIDKRLTPYTSSLKDAVKNSYNKTEMWQDFASTCVECGACNLVCPTCHCFLLHDEGSKQFAERYKSWDACLYKTFTRVAGGANPRRHLYERLRNRFDKKFAFFPNVLNYFACTGCGRCIDACPGGIDLREVLKGLVKGAWNKPPHD
ncbi:MAG: 4Fe-4S dicluster domain-containing protein [Candidatus Omnitrophota bacterium]|nr:4Fe-4S dicluster domain-containing protein [Candidatus Omnitrophota bacterium]